MPDRQNQDGVVILLEAVEGHVTGTSARYHQLSQCILHGATDQRMTNQQLDGFRYQSNRLCRRRRIGLDQEVGQPFKVGKRSSGIAQLCQDLAFGLAGLLPAMRAFR